MLGKSLMIHQVFYICPVPCLPAEIVQGGTKGVRPEYLTYDKKYICGRRQTSSFFMSLTQVFGPDPHESNLS